MIFVEVFNYVVGFINTYSNLIISIVNVILVTLIYLQIRDSRKPLITMKVLSMNKTINDSPDVLEFGTLYLTVSNVSKNVATNIKINYQFYFRNSNNKLNPIKNQKKLNYLNPNESAKILLNFGEIRERYPEYFERITVKNNNIASSITKIIPKETLKINLIVEVKYNPIFKHFFPFKIEDEYEIEWHSLKTSPRFEEHPIIFCWNMRKS
ncbi:MAG: hypothetical protein J7K36_00260 [Archaeoglobaceae archaeon]|nr:hypothetical protein [Archaeoglobaceae archaeon]